MPKASDDGQIRPPVSPTRSPEKLRPGAAYPPGYVAAHQRRRLLAAAGETLLEHGYARLTARKIADAAGVSSASFYAQFENVDDCLLGAQQAAAQALLATVDRASSARRSASRLSEPQLPWPRRIARAVQDSLRLAAEHPGSATLLACHFPSSDPRLNGSHFATVDRLASLLHSGRDTHIAEPSPELARGAVAASLSMLATPLLRRLPIAVDELAPTVTQMLLTPYLGPSRASAQIRD